MLGLKLHISNVIHVKAVCAKYVFLCCTSSSVFRLLLGYHVTLEYTPGSHPFLNLCNFFLTRIRSVLE